MMKHKHQIRTNRPSIYSQELINNVFRHPYTKIEFVVKEVGISRPTAMSYLNQLIEEGILEKFKIGRENYYVNPELFNFILNAFHTDKDTKTDIINSNMVDD
ncbi:MAG: DNA-binding protein [Muribaculaceae bacterium]|nr:DNA-binding protein [Muribaculaceae bacterium]